MTAHLHRLLDHLVWADDRVHEALEAAGGAAPPAALELYAHVLGAEHVWLARLRGEPARVAVWPQVKATDLATLARESHAALRAYVESLGEHDLDRQAAYENSAGQAFRSRVEDILLHVALHGSYHRGQIALLLRAGGATPAATDYIAYVRGSPAATRTNP